MDKLAMVHDTLQRKIDDGTLTLEQANIIYEKMEEKYSDSEEQILQKVIDGSKLSDADIKRIKSRLAELKGEDPEDDDDDDDKDEDEPEEGAKEGGETEEVKEYVNAMKLRTYKMFDEGYISESDKSTILNVLYSIY